MNIAVSQLSVEVSRVQAIVDSAVRSKPSETLKKCGVEEVEIGFKLDPPTALTLPQGKTIRVSAVGGKGPYKGDLDPQPATGVTLLQPRGTDSGFTITASADAPVNVYDLRIEDALHNVQRTKVHVVEAPATTKSPPPPGAGSGTGTATKTTPPVLDEKKLKEFAGAIQAQTIKDGGLTIVVGDTKVDSANKIVTVKIVSASSPAGVKVTDAQISEALLVKGGGAARGVKRKNIKIDR